MQNMQADFRGIQLHLPNAKKKKKKENREINKQTNKKKKQTKNHYAPRTQRRIINIMTDKTTTKATKMV